MESPRGPAVSFVSWSGYTDGGLEAFRRGKPTNIIWMDGLGVSHVISGNLDLREVIERLALKGLQNSLHWPLAGPVCRIGGDSLRNRF
jgi:hypothetical protein